MKFHAHSLLDQLRQDIIQAKSFVQQSLHEYTDAQLNFKPSDDRWSFMECIEHLNRYGDYYVPKLREATITAQRKKFLTEPTYKSGWLGDYFTKGMLPKGDRVKNKMKTFRSMNPTYSNVADQAVDKFILQQEELIDISEILKQFGGDRPRIPITITRYIKLKPIDTLRFSVAHTTRHTLQMKNVLKGIN